MNSNLEIQLSCKYKLFELEWQVNTDWQFGTFKRGIDNGHDSW